MNSAGLDVEIEDASASTAALALQGPFSRDVLEAATGESFADLRYFRRRGATVKAGRRKIAVDVSRTGYTGDLGYELWVAADKAVALWEAVTDAGAAYGIRPAGMLALDVVRLEAGLILLEVDYTSARHAMNPEQNYSPGEIGLGRLVNLDKADFVGRLALEREARNGGPSRRLVGLQLDWNDIEGLFSAQGLPPAISPVVDRAHRPVYVGGRQIGRATSVGWSPILKQAIALVSVPPAQEALGAHVDVEWTVEGRRGRVDGTVVPLPFLDLERKRR
jgi:aminomethyltransferase